MTGLFHRLTRQIVGPQPTRVHAMARLPFVPPPELPVAADAGMDTANPAAPAPSPTPEPATERVQTSVAAARTAESSPAQASPPAIAARAAAAPEATPEPVCAEPRDRHRATQTRETIGNVETAVVAPGDGGKLPAARATETPAAIGTCPDATHDAVFTAPPTANDPSVTIPPQLVSTPTGALQTHTAAGDETRPPTTRDRREGRHGNAPAPAGGPTEVHVHIGRIEVTAIPEAPPTRSKPRAVKAPMSLEEYLARRQRGRP